jgi:nicotinamide riboside transporter PnuC
MTWALVVIALIGTVMNVRRMRAGFVFWTASNLGLAAVNARSGDWAQATLYAVFLVLAVWGWVDWGQAIARAKGRTE